MGADQSIILTIRPQIIDLNDTSSVRKFDYTCVIEVIETRMSSSRFYVHTSGTSSIWWMRQNSQTYTIDTRLKTASLPYLATGLGPSLNYLSNKTLTQRRTALGLQVALWKFDYCNNVIQHYNTPRTLTGVSYATLAVL